MTGEREWVPRTDAAQIAQRLRERREASGMTQPELARKVGVARLTYVHWERGRLPGTLATATVNALEAALQVPQGWLLRHGMLPLPELGFDATDAAPHESGRDLLQARIPRARCQELGPHARRLREELGLTVAEVARACAVSHPTLSQWEQATFPKVLTAQRLRAWERALLLAPGELLAPPASHPRVCDGRWRVLIEAQTLEAAIHGVAACLATRGRNLVRPEQPLDKAASRNADLLGHRYGIGAHRNWPVVDVALSYGMARADVHKAVARLIARSAQFAFEIPVLDSIIGAGGFSSASAAVDDRVRDLAGPSLSMARAAAFADEILSRQTTGCPGRAPALISLRR
ncbi:transcriptional regulator with XRE-family HTH domain [Paraburkholderia sp. JPY465]|uniref:helix-turn-helix domain-containing protein n=1 Tax=Paraburkholderia sp. JPY465 TaxID=3042285 RepID=UPI003D1BFD1F